MNEQLFAMIGVWEIVIILMVLLVLVGLAAGLVGLVVWLTRRYPAATPPTSSVESRSPLPAKPPVVCPRCGGALPPNAPQDLCPRCVMSVGLATPTAAPGEFGPHGGSVPKPEPPPEEIARHFPQLEILECLGRGGMGVVYKARQPKLNRLVALKVLAPEKSAEPKFAERFQREAQTLAKLDHPHIVTVFDYGEAEGMFFLLMEYVDGVSLRQLLREGGIKPEEALTIVPKICEALQFAHEQGVVHRDIKPENVLLDKQGRVKIADFGIAKLIATEASQVALTGDQSVLGTPHYMAPEQVEKPHLVDHRADIYSLGVMFYEMLTRELPLGKFALPSQKVAVDVRLDEVVLHALEKEPERRYQHASEVGTDVETIRTTAALSPNAPSSDRPEHGARSFLWSDLLGNVWALAALILLVGKKVARTQPLMYSFFDVGGWYYPASYHLLVAVCFALALACLVMPRLTQRGRASVSSRGTIVWGDAWASVWALAAMVLLVGKNVARTQPTMYSFFNGGGWYYPASYHGLVAICFGFALICLVLPRLKWRGLTSSGTRDFRARPMNLTATEVEAAHAQVQIPAVGVLVAGCLDLGLPIIALLRSFTAVAVASPERTSTVFLGLPVVAMLFIVGVILAGACHMRRLTNRNLAMTASILAMIFPPGALVGLPCGIWSLIVLNRPEVRAAFKDRERKTRSKAFSGKTWRHGAMVHKR